ncbi:MAG: HesA/MoeB/ThiF family protein [Prolixibacteraceae bacterium]
MKHLTESDKTRFTRHISLPEIGTEGQVKLKNAHVLVIGAGGLGSPLLTYLAAAGIGQITIADDDVVSLGNLQRQILYGTNDLGKKKVYLAQSRINELYPETKVVCHDFRLNPENADKLIVEADVVVDCTDNYKTRSLIGSKTSQHSKPLVFASVLNFEAQVTVFNFQGGPSLTGLFPELPPDGLFQENEIGLVGVLPGIAGTLQASEVLKIIVGYGEVLSGKLLVFSLLKNDFNTFRF